MMKKAIKLLVLAGALLSVGAMAQNTTTQKWNFKFPKYAYIYTNTTAVNFDFTDDTADGTASTLSLYQKAGSTNLQTCIDDFVSSLSSDLEANATSSSNIPGCDFAPSGMDKSGYTVNWGSGNTADGSLLVITNASGYTVQVKVDNTVPAGVVYKVAPKLTSAVTASDFITLSTNDTSFASDSNDYTTQYNSVYVIPLAFAANVSPSAADTSANSSGVDSIVTYTVSAQ